MLPVNKKNTSYFGLINTLVLVNSNYLLGRDTRAYNMASRNTHTRAGKKNRRLRWRGLAVRADRYPAKRHGLQVRASEVKLADGG
jgi:hypothetical protein